MDYFILIENTTIIGVYETFLECLSWKPTRVVQEPIEIHHISINKKGESKVEIIRINKDLFLHEE